MARIRSVKPDFFRHYPLFCLERDTGLPLRVGFEGVWTACDKRGRFRWEPEKLKLDALPYDDVDMGDVLGALLQHDYLGYYEVEGVAYGYVVGWEIEEGADPGPFSQAPRKDEAASHIPDPPARRPVAAKQSRTRDAAATKPPHVNGGVSVRGKKKATPKAPPAQELEGMAWERVKRYREKVKPASLDASGSRAKGWLVRRLKAGETPAALDAAVDAYACHCEQAQTEPQYRFNVGNFFGQDALYRDHVAGSPGKGHHAKSLDAWKEVARAARSYPDDSEGQLMVSSSYQGIIKACGGYPIKAEYREKFLELMDAHFERRPVSAATG